MPLIAIRSPPKVSFHILYKETITLTHRSKNIPLPCAIVKVSKKVIPQSYFFLLAEIGLSIPSYNTAKPTPRFAAHRYENNGSRRS